MAMAAHQTVSMKKMVLMDQFGPVPRLMVTIMNQHYAQPSVEMD